MAAVIEFPVSRNALGVVRMRLNLARSLVRGLGLVVFLSTGCAAPNRAPPGPVVEPAELAARLNTRPSPSVVVLEVRDAEACQAAHVAGAVRVDPAGRKEESLAAEAGLDHETLWHERIGDLGVSGRGPVVIYDDGRMTGAARAWFIFQHSGVPELGALSDGYPALKPPLRTAG